MSAKLLKGTFSDWYSCNQIHFSFLLCWELIETILGWTLMWTGKLSRDYPVSHPAWAKMGSNTTKIAVKAEFSCTFAARPMNQTAVAETWWARWRFELALMFLISSVAELSKRKVGGWQMKSHMQKLFPKNCDERYTFLSLTAAL